MSTTSRSRVIALLLAATVLVGGANLAAYAANGKPLLLGKSNVATKKTVVKNKGSGPALQLKTKSGQAPLKVNSKTKVTKLNADLVDGSHAADLKTTAYRYVLPASAGLTGVVSFTLPGLPPGQYAASYAVSGKHSEVPSFFACWFQDPGAILGVTLADYNGLTSYLSGSTYLHSTGDEHTFQCQASSGTYGLQQHVYPSEVLLTRIDVVNTGTPTASREAAKGNRVGR